jgi:hypothetical protein
MTNLPVKGADAVLPDLDQVVQTAHLRANAVSGAKLATGVVRQTVADGADETSTHLIPVTGMATGDEVVSVLVFTTKASIATMAAHAGTFTATTNGITPGTDVDNSGNQYLVTWIDKT